MSLPSNDKKEILTFFIKLTSLISILSALLGVGYQKGLIEGISLGRLNANLDIQEILFSAAVAFIEVYTKLSNAIVMEEISWGPIVVITSLFIIISLAITYALRNPAKPKKKLMKYNIRFKRFVTSSAFINYMASTILAIIISLISIISSFIIFRGVLLIISLCVFPTSIGYLIGISKANDLRENPPCVAVSNKILQGKFVSQCTTIEIDGKSINGRVLLENKEGYIIQTNDAFIYLSRDRKYCISSKYEVTTDWKIRNEKDVLNGDFLPSSIDGLCQSKDIKTKLLLN